MKATAEGEGAPADINLMDLVDMRKVFAQTSTVSSKSNGAWKYAAVQSELSHVHDRDFLNLNILRS